MSKDIIYVDGTFDMIHSGHIKFFEKIKKDGDYLIVGVTSDENVQSYKRNPIISHEDRAILLENIGIVDKVIRDCPFQNIPESFIDEHKITKIYYAGNVSDWREHYKVAIDRGIMKYIEYSHDELSTSSIINKIRKDTKQSEIICDKVYVKKVADKGYGAFAKVKIAKGELIEKGIMKRVDVDGNKNPFVFNWSDDRTVWAYPGGCATFYNTSRNSNTIMTRYFDKDIYEIHAKVDIKEDEELTHTYRSLEWRDAFEDLRSMENL